MKTIDIRKQPRLGFSRTVTLTINGIKYRIFRSIVTMSVITVAIAFLMNSLTESLVKKSVAASTRSRIASLRQAVTWAGRLSAPASEEAIIDTLATAPEGSPLLREAAGFGGLDAAALDKLQEDARIASLYLGYLDGLNYGHRRQLVHNATGTEIFTFLADEKGWQRFTSTLDRNKSLELPTEIDVLQSLVTRWPDVHAQVAKIRDGQRAAITTIQAALADTPMLTAMAGVAGEFGKTLNDAGFILEPEVAEIVAKQSKALAQRSALDSSFGLQSAKKAVAGKLDVLPIQMNAERFWSFVSDQGSADWYLKTMADLGKPLDIDAATVVDLAAQRRDLNSLLKAERLIGDVGGGPLGIGERMTWLLFVSMLVCAVGIANAMLMTVTERFREIATLKCLGALDGFIMLVFVLEASFLGLIGGFIGAIIGGIIGTLRMVAMYGLQASGGIRITDLLLAGVIAMFLGTLLGVLAAIYPSFKAARLAPMEAMRVE